LGGDLDFVALVGDGHFEIEHLFGADFDLERRSGFTAKPSAAALTWYEPGNRLGTEYDPASLVAAVCLMPVSRFVTEMLARVTNAPEGSRTVPRSAPPATCAREGIASETDKAKAAVHHTCLVFLA
jgi:hypothetical protein